VIEHKTEASAQRKGDYDGDDDDWDSIKTYKSVMDMDFLYRKGSKVWFETETESMVRKREEEEQKERSGE
jgi:hypothetical protein